MKKDKNNLRRKALSSFIVMVFALLSFTGVTYAYWTSVLNINQLPPQEEVVPIGEGVAGSATVVLNTSSQSVGNLTPYTSVTLTYDIYLSADNVEALGGETTLTALISNKALNGNKHVPALSLFHFDVSVSGLLIVGDETVTVTIIVTMDEPANQGQYHQVAGKTLTFDVVLTATVNEE